MKYLFLLLLIAGPAHGQGSIRDEFKKTKSAHVVLEKELLRRTWPGDADLFKRLVRVEDNFRHALDPSEDNLKRGEKSAPVFWENYVEIYRDTRDGAYYAGLFREISDYHTNGIKKVNWGRPIHKTNRQRMVVVTNIAPNLTLIADAADWGQLYTRRIVPIYDFYKGVLLYDGFLYSDPENKNPLKMLPITNRETGGVAYKGISPNTGRVFYMNRYLHPHREYTYDLENVGNLYWPADTLEEIWEKQKPQEFSPDDVFD